MMSQCKEKLTEIAHENSSLYVLILYENRDFHLNVVCVDSNANWDELRRGFAYVVELQFFPNTIFET